MIDSIAGKPLKNIFAIRREERGLALTSFLLLLGLHALMWAYYPASFYKAGKLGFWSIFYNRMHLSGFDDYSYIFVSSARIYYDLPRHPLYALLLSPLYWANQGLQQLTGTNCAVFLVSALTIFAGVYALIFLYRILRYTVGLCRTDAHLLTLLFFSFAMVMLSLLVPDHFCLSLFFLLLTLWLAMSPRPQPLWLVSVLTTLTGGTTLSNISKSWLAVWFVRGRRCLRPATLLAVVVVPVALFVGAGVWQNETIIKPLEARGKAMLEKKIQKDSTVKAKLETHDKEMKARGGKPIADNFLLRQTNVSTSRGPSIVENLLGESLQFHQKELLKDYSVDRPAIVRYNHWWQYGVVAVVVALALGGIFCAHPTRLVYILLSWFCCDVLLHVGLGFGLNEVYIMSAHWIFILPILIGVLLFRLSSRMRWLLRGIIALLTAYLLVYNGSLLVGYLVK